MLAAMLRKLAHAGQYGHSRTPRNYYMTTSYCSFYWDNHGRFVPDHETWVRVAALSARYHRFCMYVEETAPRWVEVNRTYWADNSVDSHQVSADGTQTRTVQLTAPHGDVCY